MWFFFSFYIGSSFDCLKQKTDFNTMQCSNKKIKILDGSYIKHTSTAQPSKDGKEFQEILASSSSLNALSPVQLWHIMPINHHKIDINMTGKKENILFMTFRNYSTQYKFENKSNMHCSSAKNGHLSRRTH